MGFIRKVGPSPNFGPQDRAKWSKSRVWGKMVRTSGVIAGLVAIALGGVSTAAYAQTKNQPAPAAASDQGAWSLNAGRKSLQWQDNGRWGLKLDFQTPSTRQTEWKDVNAGVNYKFSPRLDVGASVNLGAQTPPTRFAPDEKPQPRVRLETTFRF
jgi:hypothetical protein